MQCGWARWLADSLRSSVFAFQLMPLEVENDIIIDPPSYRGSRCLELPQRDPNFKHIKPPRPFFHHGEIQLQSAHNLQKSRNKLNFLLSKHNHLHSPNTMSDKNTSTLQSYIDSASGAAQTLLGNITGSSADQHQGQAKQDKAQVENDASHAGTSFAGYSASSSGAITKNDPQRQEGSWNQTIGSGKEMVGNLIGSEVCPV